MAVPEQTPYKEYTANGVTKIFPLEFDVLEQDHLIVLVNDLEPSVGSWSLDAENDTVVFALPPANGANIKIRRDTPLERPNDYGNYNATLKPTTVNTDFDNIWRKLQEMGVLNWMIDNNIKDLNEYVDSLNDETKAIFLQMIQEQGTSLEQLDAYVDQLYKNLANVAADNGWFADFVADGDENQKQINDETLRNFESIAQLKNYVPRKNKQTVSVKSRLPPNFGLKSPYAGGGEFQYIALSTEPENGGTIFSSNVASGKWHRVYSEDVCASWFCGFGGVSNDATTSMQKAIDFTNSITNASAICIDDKFLITSSLMIDRKTDTTKGEYVIYANGNNNGFLINTPITMFSSRLDYLPSDAPAYTKAACSEFTTFRGIDFESTIQHVDALIFDDKFLRLTFDGCTHRKIQAIKDAEYLQTVRWINNCKHRQHVGFFVNVTDAYDCRVSFSQFENSAAGFNFRGIARGCHFNDTLYQGSTSPFIRSVGFFGGSIDRNYFEQNLDAEIVLGVLGGVSSGYTINSNIFMLRQDLASDNTFFPVQVGPSRGFSLGGNTSTGNLANTDSASLFEISENGNTVPVGKLVMSSNANTPLNFVPANSENQEHATLIRHKVNIISSSPSINAAVKLPVINTFTNGTTIKISNDTDNGLYIYPNVNERISGVSYNSPHLIGARSKIELAKSDSDYWTII